MLEPPGHHVAVPPPEPALPRDTLRVAYTLEQCWHEFPGGTAVAANRVAERLARRPDVELVGVAGRHRHDPPPEFRPPIAVHQLPIARPWLYETWTRLGVPKVERATGPVDVCHATGLVPAATRAPLVVTVHDLAFVRWPERFTDHGARVMRRSLDVIRRRADLVLASSSATVADLVDAGIGTQRVRLVLLGVDEAAPDDGRAAVAARERFGLPERFVLFVGTLEPRKNLPRLAAAVRSLDDPVPLVVAGASGWGDQQQAVADEGVQFVGFVDDVTLDGLYRAASVFAYPSEWEGFGLPVAEAMARGVPVVTSGGTSTEEVAGGAAVLVDPLDVDDIARGLSEALADGDRLGAAGRQRARTLSWEATAAATLDAYREVAG